MPNRQHVIEEARRRDGCVDRSRVWRRTHVFGPGSRCTNCGVSRDDYIAFLVDIAERLAGQQPKLAPSEEACV